jgi:hypothetical protein
MCAREKRDVKELKTHKGKKKRRENKDRKRIEIER